MGAFARAGEEWSRLSELAGRSHLEQAQLAARLSRSRLRASSGRALPWSSGRALPQPGLQVPFGRALSRFGLQKDCEQPSHAHADGNSQGKLPRPHCVGRHLRPVGRHGKAHRVVQRGAGDERHDGGNHEQQRGNVAPLREGFGIQRGKGTRDERGEEHAVRHAPDGQIDRPAEDAAD